MGGQRENWPAVELWRGVAALLVVASHWAPLVSWKDPVSSFGFTGVDVFFVISGFVFAPHLLSHSPHNLRAYAIRRVMRIYPAYLVALAAYALLRWWEGQALLYLPQHLLMVHLQSREMAFYYAAPFWSLPAEVAFYAAVPLLGWAGMHFGRGEKGRLRAFWCSIFAIAIATRGWLMANADAQTQNAAYIALHHLPGLLIEFLVGVAAWSALEGMKRRRGDGRAAWKALGWAGLAGMAGACVAWNLLESHRGHDWFHGQLGIVVAACFAVVLVSTASWAPASASAAGLAAWAGRLSYGTYLLHPLWGSGVGALEPRVGAAYALLAGMAGLFLSVWALNVLIEEPARQWGRRWAAKWDTSAGPARADQ